MRVIDMHNHMVAPEVVAFLEREGERYVTRLIERDGKRFFLIQDSALRPITDKITQADARLSDMEVEGVDVQAVSCVPLLLHHLTDTYGAERLVVGSDYPLPAGLAHPVAEVKALGLAPEAEAAILGGNAGRLLRID
jgi:aminocarboxymuconate-semialdehyde decarboxylase